ncbi:MAG: sulfatase family protein [Isosphaeraceae bacterium]
MRAFLMRYGVLWSIISLVFVSTWSTWAGAAPPNLIVILSDDQGRGDYSAFGTPDIRTPAIDRLFREGMDLRNFYASCPVCSPTRAALLTGCYPDRVGVPGVIRTHAENSWGFLSPRAVLLPRVLKSAGYHTAIVGKWHLGLESPNTPTERGFDTFRGYLGDMMDDYTTHRRHGINYMRHGQKEVDPKGHATDLFTDWAVEYLAERANADRPFFLYLAYNAPHDPIQPPADWVRKVRERQPGIDDSRARLVALIEHMDAGIGRVLDALDRLGLAKETLVVFTSDNGGVASNGANNGPYRGQKQHMYEGGLRVPGAARWPGRIAAGSRADRVVATMDLFPTLCQAAGASVPPGLDGISFLPTLLGAPGPQPQPDQKRELYFVRREGGPAYGGKTIEALIRGDWKLIQDSPFRPRELYNLHHDPRETTNLIEKERRIAAELSAALSRHIQHGGEVPWQPASTPEPRDRKR